MAVAVCSKPFFFSRLYPFHPSVKMWLPGRTLALRNPSSVAAAPSGIASSAAKPGTGFWPGLPGPRCSTATMTNDHRFALGPASAPPRTFFAATHVALVGLDQTAELIAPITVGHRLAQLMQQQPGGLIADPDLLFQLQGRDALLVVAEAINSPKPTS